MKKYITDLLYFLPFLALFIFTNCSGNKEKKVKQNLKNEKIKQEKKSEKNK